MRRAAEIVVDLPLAISSGVKLTRKSWLKLLAFEETQLKRQPMRRKRSISATGARETARR